MSNKNEPRFFLCPQNIMASDINLEKTMSLQDERFHNFKGLRKDDKAMSVFLLTSMNDLNFMKNFTKLLTRSKIIYLVLFMESEDSSFLKNCLQPVGNPLSLNKGVSFLVKCDNDSMVREWHSFHGNDTVTFNRGTWDRETGFNITSKEIFLNDKDILSGKVLFSILSVDDHAQQEYFASLTHSLEKAGNFTIKKYKWLKSYGAYNQSHITWNNTKQLFKNGSVDLAMGFYSYIPINLKKFDLCEPLTELEFVFLIRSPKIKVLVSWSGYLKPFTFGAWMAFIFIIISSLCIQIFMKTKIKKDIYETSIGDDLFYIYGIFCQQNLPEFPKPGPAKIFHLSISIFTFFVLSIYSASFVSQLTIVDTNLPFKSTEEFAEVKSHKLIAFKFTANYNKLKNGTTPVWQKIAKLLMKDSLLPNVTKDATDMVCKENVALFTDELFIPMIINNNVPNVCHFTAIRTGEFHPVSFILRKNSPYTTMMRQIVQKFRTNGILTRMKDSLFRKSFFLTGFQKLYPKITILDVVTLLAILLGGVAFSLSILFFENIYIRLYRMKTAKTSPPFKANARLRNNWTENRRKS